jgi:hypothetical protein
VDRLLASEEAEHLGLGGGVGVAGFDLGGRRGGWGRGAGAVVVVRVGGGGASAAADVELVHEGLVLRARSLSVRLLLLRHVCRTRRAKERGMRVN